MNSLQVFQDNGWSSSTAAVEATVVNGTAPSAAISGGVVAQNSTQNTPLPVMSSSSTNSSMNSSSISTVYSDISAVTLTPKLSTALGSLPITSTTSSAGSYVNATLGASQTTGIPIPARKRDLHRHLARHQKGRHGGM